MRKILNLLVMISLYCVQNTILLCYDKEDQCGECEWFDKNTGICKPIPDLPPNEISMGNFWDCCSGVRMPQITICCEGKIYLFQRHKKCCNDLENQVAREKFLNCKYLCDVEYDLAIADILIWYKNELYNIEQLKTPASMFKSISDDNISKIENEQLKNYGTAASGILTSLTDTQIILEIMKFILKEAARIKKENDEENALNTNIKCIESCKNNSKCYNI